MVGGFIFATCFLLAGGMADGTLGFWRLLCFLFGLGLSFCADDVS